MAAMRVEFALNLSKLRSSWSFGGESRVVGRDGCAISGRKRVAVSAPGRTGAGSLRLVSVACAEPSDSPSQPKPRKPRGKCEGPSKTDQKLVKDLKEFILNFDLPPKEVPTTKELLRNGRQDLANAVRRRGYKVVAHLLGFAPGAEAAQSPEQADDLVIDSANRAVSQNGAAVNLSANNDRITKFGEEGTQVPSVPKDGRPVNRSAIILENAKLNGYISTSKDAVEEETARANADPLTVEPEKEEFLGPSTGNRESKYIQERQLEIIKGASQTLELLQKSNAATDGEVGNDMDDGDVSESEADEDEEDSVDDDDEDDVEDDVPVVELDSGFGSPEDIAAKKAALLRTRIQEFFISRNEDHGQPEPIPDVKSSMPTTSLRGKSDGVERDVELERNQKLEAEKELDRYRDLLQAREVVLTELTRELEEAKAQFSLARAKATAELVHANQLAAERNARLQAAEQALASLKQVHLEWWGEAGQVELAGTFNGWQHRILLEPDPTSEIPKPDGSRGPMMWGTHLCLYPGIYEIKFIVDGVWELDHRREVVMRHGNQNNILRVD